MQLTNEQLTAIRTPGNLSVTASAGTGKTTVLTQRFMYCAIERGTSPEQILAFTFTDKASHEMKTRIVDSGNFPTEIISQLNISTFHAFCRRILTAHGELLGLGENFEMHDTASYTIWRETKVHQWLSKNLQDKNHPLSLFAKKYSYTRLQQVIFSLLELNLCFVPPEEQVGLSANDETLSPFLRTNAEFQEELLRERISQDSLCFDDLELLAWRLLEKNIEIRQEIQKKFRHILVDEFQDISPRQFEIIKKIYNPELNEIFIVGDPKQSIYGFRGTSFGVFSGMTSIIENSGGKSIYLHETFRTPHKIQEFFNLIFTKVFDPSMFQKGMSHNTKVAGEIHCIQIPDDINSTSKEHDFCATYTSEAIQKLLSQGIHPATIAILGYKKNILPIYKNSLEKQGIPTSIKEQAQVLDDPTVKTAWHILNYLADLENNSSNKISQVGILRSPIFDFSESFIHHLIKSGDNNFFHEQTLDLFTPHSDQTRWAQLTHLLKKWREQASKIPVADLYQIIMDDLGVDASPFEMMLSENFYQLLLCWQKQNLSSLSECRPLLKKLHSQSLETPLSQNHAGGVQLMTFHSAKGLEFDHLFLVPGNHRNNETPIFLHKSGQGFLFKTPVEIRKLNLKYELEESQSFLAEQMLRQQQRMEELARLVYVALTRVKKSLCILHSAPTQTLLKLLKKNPDDLTALKSYNDWMYWICKQSTTAPSEHA